MAKHRRLHKITFSRHRNIFIRPVFSKLRSKQPNNFPQQPRTQNPPCNTLATIQTSNIERPDPRVTHHDVYHKMDGNQTTKEKTQPSFVEKSLNLIKTPLKGLSKDLKKKFNFLKTKRIVPKVIYCLRYCFLLTKDCMHNEVWGCAETLPR